MTDHGRSKHGLHSLKCLCAEVGVSQDDLSTLVLQKAKEAVETLVPQFVAYGLEDAIGVKQALNPCCGSTKSQYLFVCAWQTAHRTVLLVC
jgi:hypothetical protein